MLIDGSHFEISNAHAQFNDIHYKIMIFISLPFALETHKCSLQSCSI